MKRPSKAVEFVVQSDIKLSGSSKYPFGEMAIGDSFAFRDNDKKMIQSASASYGRTHSMKFSVRGNRIWRIQ